MFISISLILYTGHNEFIDKYLTFTFLKEHPLISSIFLVITELGSIEAILLISTLLLVLLWLQRKIKLLLLFLCLSIGGLILNITLKMLFQRDRPGELSEIEAFGQSLEIVSYSFPSGHTMRSVILLLFILYLLQTMQRGLIRNILFSTTVFFLIAVPLSRIITGAHFPSDVLAAIFISISWFCLCLFISNKPNTFSYKA